MSKKSDQNYKKAMNAKPKKHKKSKFQIITMTAVWAMIIFTLLGMILPPVVQMLEQYMH